MTYSFERTRGTWNLLQALYSVLHDHRKQSRTHTEQQAYLYSFTNRLKEQFGWFVVFVRLHVCHVCMFDCFCITMGVLSDCCLCFSICLVVPSRQLRRWEFLSANHIIPR